MLRFVLQDSLQRYGLSLCLGLGLYGQYRNGNLPKQGLLCKIFVTCSKAHRVMCFNNNATTLPEILAKCRVHNHHSHTCHLHLVRLSQCSSICHFLQAWVTDMHSPLRQDYVSIHFAGQGSGSYNNSKQWRRQSCWRVSCIFKLLVKVLFYSSWVSRHSCVPLFPMLALVAVTC